jgi:hypothetical protein
VNVIEEGEAFVIHYFDQVYDPIKAHQYYEEHKQLKGRQPAKSENSSSKRSSGSPSSGNKNNLAAQETAAQKKAKLDAEVAALKARLEQLRALLRELVAEAKKRSGVEVDAEGKTSSENTKPSDDKLTPAEKAEKAQKAHDYYEKTKGTLPSQETTHVLKKKIALIEKKISEMREKLASLPLATAQIEETTSRPKSDNLNNTQNSERPSPSGPENIKQAVRKGDSQNGS